MDPETTGTTRPGETEMTWIDLAQHIAAMTPEQRRRPVYFCDSDNGHGYTPGLVLAGDDLPDESVQLLHRNTSVIPGGSFFLTPNVTTQDAPAHPADDLVLVALDLDDGEEPPADFETATGISYWLSEVEDVGEGRRLAWYFRQEASAPTIFGRLVPSAGMAVTTGDTGGRGKEDPP